MLPETKREALKAAKEAKRETIAVCYQKLKALGVCVTCTKRPAVEGKVNCAECAAKASAVVSKHYTKHRETTNEKMKSRYRDRRKKGLCVTCAAPVIGSAKCFVCAEKAAAYARKYNERRLKKATQPAAPQPEASPAAPMIHAQPDVMDPRLEKLCANIRETREADAIEAMQISLAAADAIGHTA